jgi:hypothetical protein
MDKQVCIVIPTYKPFDKLTENEQLSWHQCLRVLGSRKFYVVCPHKLITAGYLASATEHGVSCKVVTFAPGFFSDVDGYNRLMLSRQFYKPFIQHEYLLLYQLDAFVFRDDLSRWCARGYSYVGSPWFEDYIPASENAKLWQVGNGGFALRRVADCLRALRTFTVARPWAKVIEDHSPSGPPTVFKKLYLISRYLLLKNNTHWLLNDFHLYRQFHQEDYFWGVVCKDNFSWYKVPTPQEALSFGFEVAPSKMYALNQRSLPMGCHAWEKHEPAFWKPIIAEAIAAKP